MEIFLWSINMGGYFPCSFYFHFIFASKTKQGKSIFRNLIFFSSTVPWITKQRKNLGFRQAICVWCKEKILSLLKWQSKLLFYSFSSPNIFFSFVSRLFGCWKKHGRKSTKNYNIMTCSRLCKYCLLLGLKSPHGFKTCLYD